MELQGEHNYCREKVKGLIHGNSLHGYNKLRSRKLFQFSLLNRDITARVLLEITVGVTVKLMLQAGEMSSLRSYQ
jgi:hypothetical protein